MPLYMDFHKIPGITVDDAKKAHTADEKIQKKYGVKYLQFWVNEGAGTVFCLVEGPDKTTCETVHQMAHGHLPCAMVEVDPSYYALIMGENSRIDHGLVHNHNGTIDLAYRSILAITFLPKPKVSAATIVSPVMRELIQAKISESNGRVIKIMGEDTLLGAFDSAGQAVQSATAIQSGLLSLKKNKKTAKDFTPFMIGVCAGQPVTENNEFMEETIRLAARLSAIAGENKILVSSLVRELADEGGLKKKNSISALNSGKETFMTSVFDVIEARLSDENLTIEDLSKEVGISRPQLYRKIIDLTGKAPNDLIRDLRLDKAFSMLRRDSGNVSEIAFRVGFGNPSYFAKCFSKRFGYSPSKLAAMG